jgi:hypothetical protein
MRSCAYTSVWQRTDPTGSRAQIESQHNYYLEGNMDILKIAAIVLIAGGILGLVQGGYTYTKQTHEARL